MRNLESKINVATGFFVLRLASEPTRTEFFETFQLIYGLFFGVDVLIAVFLLSWQNAEYLVRTTKKILVSNDVCFVDIRHISCNFGGNIAHELGY